MFSHFSELSRKTSESVNAVQSDKAGDSDNESLNPRQMNTKHWTV